MNIRATIYGSELAEAGKVPLLRPKRPTGAIGDALDSITVVRTAARTSDGRGGDRHRLLKPAVRVVHRRARHDVALINLSGGGAMIEGDLAPRLWDRVDLHLADEGVIECAVRWLKGNRIGLEFAHETRIEGTHGDEAALLREVIAANFPKDRAAEQPRGEAVPCPEQGGAVEIVDDDQRGEKRHPLIWSGNLHYNHDTAPVRLRNISPIGALIECSARLDVGGEPLLDLGDGGSVFATISWVVGDQAGLRFKDRYDLRRLARKRPEVAPAQWHAPTYLDPAPGKYSPWAKQWKRQSVDDLREELEGFLKR